MNPQRYTRRQMLLQSAALAGLAVPGVLLRAAETARLGSDGVVAGEPTAADVGNNILRQGGNAVDAVVAGALAACVVSPHNCGIAGYGGHMLIASKSRRKITAIDFNTAAPRAARADLFALDERGLVRDRANEFGWLACGVPGTLAGLQLAIDRYGTKSFRELAAPAIRLARNGFPVGAGLAGALRAMAARLRKDPGSAGLYLRDGEPYAAGEMFHNPDLAATMEALNNSTGEFYHGALAQNIADQFRRNGGLLTAQDMADYRAYEVEPLRWEWDAVSILTAPLTAGGVTMLQALSILKALHWPGLPSSTDRAHARVEALRIAWQDRLELLGDPPRLPMPRLFSSGSARKAANVIRTAVKQHQPVPIRTVTREQGGTVHLSAVDRLGNLVALTLTQGNAFGSGVTIEGLGLTFGHGISRFEVRPGHPNSIGPGKRPLHNMCPTVVVREGKPHLAIGGAGGRRIVNGVFEVLLQYATGAQLENAIAAPRLNTFGGLELEMERNWPKAEADYLKSIGFNFVIGPAARITAVSIDWQTGEIQQASR